MYPNSNIWDVFWTKQNIVRWQVAGVIRSLVNATDLRIDCATFLHETLIVTVLTYGSETMLWKE